MLTPSLDATTKTVKESEVEFSPSEGLNRQNLDRWRAALTEETTEMLARGWREDLVRVARRFLEPRQPVEQEGGLVKKTKEAVNTPPHPISASITEASQQGGAPPSVINNNNNKESPNGERFGGIRVAAGTPLPMTNSIKGGEKPAGLQASLPGAPRVAAGTPLPPETNRNKSGEKPAGAPRVAAWAPLPVVTNRNEGGEKPAGLQASLPGATRVSARLCCPPDSSSSGCKQPTPSKRRIGPPSSDDSDESDAFFEGWWDSGDDDDDFNEVVLSSTSQNRGRAPQPAVPSSTKPTSPPLHFDFTTKNGMEIEQIVKKVVEHANGFGCHPDFTSRSTKNHASVLNYISSVCGDHPRLTPQLKEAVRIRLCAVYGEVAEELSTEGEAIDDSYAEKISRFVISHIMNLGIKNHPDFTSQRPKAIQKANNYIISVTQNTEISPAELKFIRRRLSEHLQ
jgi:hypothetical protein